ncbi:hypothetical protein E4H04_02980 [Candidatus Bathyarchaeota archaeon]|nr:MAG: hypothetical protein E4H04_02980 [Candidatus Bathyarchaeota archaeon]
MKTKQRFTIILALIIIMMTQIAPVYSENTPIIQVSSENIYIKPGQENTIIIKLQNIGDDKVYDVESFLTSSSQGLTVLTKSNNVFTEIGANSIKSYQPTIYVDQNIDLGAYSLTLTVKYRSTLSQQQTINVPVGLVVSEIFTPKIVYSPTIEQINVKTGMLNNVEFRFTNIGGKALQNLEIVLSSVSSNILLQDSVSTSIDAVQIGQSFTINPTVSIIEETPLGTYSISATLSYKDTDGNRFHQSFSLPISLTSAAAVRNSLVTIEDMKIVEENIHPGDIFTFDIAVKCSSADAYDLVSSLSFNPSSPLAPISPSIVNVGDLNTGETAIARYRMLVSGGVAAGQYPVTITIGYTNNKGVPKVLTETATILVDGLIDFELLDSPSGIASKGVTMELEADLLLIGTESVDFVSIGVVEDDVINRVSGSEEYIGAVDPDSPIPFTINYKVDDNALEGEHELKLNVTYRDHLNREHIEQIKLDITIGGVIDDNPQPQQSGFWVWIRRLFGLGP